jgi:hypothetical protein
MTMIMKVFTVNMSSSANLEDVLDMVDWDKYVNSSGARPTGGCSEGQVAVTRIFNVIVLHALPAPSSSPSAAAIIIVLIITIIITMTRGLNQCATRFSRSACVTVRDAGGVRRR